MIEFLADNNFGDTRSGGLAGPTGLVLELANAGPVAYDQVKGFD